MAAARTKKQQALAASADDARADALSAFLNQMEKDKPGEVRALSDESIVDIDVFPTGAISLDVALGVGGIPRGRITEIYGPTGGGKCLTADTLVWTDHGLETIKELFARAGQPASCTSRTTDVRELDLRVVNEHGELEQVAVLTHNNRRPVRRVKLASGRHVDATFNHPLRVMSENGYIVWRELGQIERGDRLVSASFGAGDGAGTNLGIEEALLLGYLVGEGSLGYDNSIRFTNHDPDTVADYEAALTGVVGEEFVLNHYGVTESTPAGKEHVVFSKALRAEFAERYGLDFVNAPAKTVPYAVRTAGAKAQRHFLSALFESDGWIANERVGFASASEQLAREVQLLLLGLGMQGTMRPKFNPDYQRDYYYLTLSREGSRKFLDDIGFRTKRRDIAAHGPRDDAGDMTRNIPALGSQIRAFRDAVDSDRELDRLVQHLIARPQTAAISPKQLTRIVEWADRRAIPVCARALLEHLRYLAEADFIYDEVVAVEDLGELPTFDLMVPDTHSFIANGVCSHNTTLAISAAVNCQRQGGNVGFIDAEHALSRELCLNMGVDPDRFVVYQPDHGEDAVEMCQSMLESGAFDMVVVDSVASMTPKAEIEADVEQHGMAHHARLMSKFMRRITGLVSSTDTALVLLNQVRKNLGAYGTPDTSTGGQAIPFFSTIRVVVRTSNSKRIERNKEFVGTTVTAQVIKNKLASPFRQAEYDIMFGKGIEAGGSLLAVCEKLGLVTRSGASYTDATTGVKLGVGKDKVKASIEADEELRARLTESVYAALQAKANVFGTDAAEFEEANSGVADAEELPDKFDDAAEVA